ncbi:MAG: hypothetical protein J3K34DRAFT_407807 [Monoraphidium minutum]|nr:MAG: hypothetical protein J3K34DRAFT_407807 [Monoraphidium minutum]
MIPRSCAADVLPRSRAAVPPLPAVRASRHYPVVVTPNPSVGSTTYNGSASPQQHLELNGPQIAVDGDLWKGNVIIHMANLLTTDKSVFAGKKRLVHVAAQGRFKRRVRAAAVCTGQEFHIPIAGGNTGAEWILEQVLRACARVFSKTTIVDAHGECPSFYNPIIAACQLINVARQGEEPDMWGAKEDARLLSPALCDGRGRPMEADKRRKWCDDPDNVEGLAFDPDLVYTFHIYQHMMDFGAYKVHIGPMAFDLTCMLSSQPLQLFVKDVDNGEYAYSALVWHERLLYPDEHAEAQREARKAAREAGGSLSSRLGKGLRMW